MALSIFRLIPTSPSYLPTDAEINEVILLL